MFFFRTKKTSSNGGFSLLEVAVATGIMAVALVTMMSLFAYNLRIEIMNRNKVIASYLAQEALEIVKQKRDTNWFADNSSSGWLKGIPDGDGLVLAVKDKNSINKGWNISSSAAANAKKVCLYNGNYIQSASGGGTETGFTRTMNIDTSVPNRAKITVYVKYNNDRNSVAVTSYLYNNWLYPK